MTVRHLGTFLAAPIKVQVVEYVAEQLGVADPSCLMKYAIREPTHREHAGEIQQAYGLRDFSEVVEEVTSWLDARSWTTGEGPKALFDGAVGWLRERQVLLPGMTTLTKLVGHVREEATQRLWESLCELLSTEQRRMLDLLLEVPDGARISELERLRKGPTKESGPQMGKALKRIIEVAGLGISEMDVAAVGGAGPLRAEREGAGDQAASGGAPAGDGAAAGGPGDR
ncbi:DUF4158 domain-containing protein [Streptosporangium sp. NPDC006930]|uniref:DUF4158 domain-containing protein n=1 Tax=unclassified Streptosporangium TaxID=2632669 RepID=UPI003444454D